jgi:aldehyde dehydrogenase (NAD+)
MSTATLEGPRVAPDTAASAIQEAYTRQRAFFYTETTKDLKYRMEALKKLRKAIKDWEPKILAALKQDLNKSAFEGYASEIGFVLEELNHTIKHLYAWARPKRYSGPISQALSTCYVHYEPYGNVLIIAPWNYPFQLTVSPLIGALASGNTALIKPSEVTPATSAVVRDMIAATFPPEYVTVVEGGINTNQTLLELPFDYIFFTGSPRVGQIVMEAASKHLTPVTLELGGKSPVFVDSDVAVKTAAKRLMWGKTFNAGQTCIAPDYVLVDRKVKDKFLAEMKAAIQTYYGDDPSKSEDYGRIINDHHFRRVSRFIDNGDVYHGGRTDAAQRYIEPTILLNTSLDSDVMQEEIFGPILPVLEYSSLDEALDLVRSRPKPLALYVFTNSKKYEQTVLSRTSSGGGCVNDTLVHLTSPHLPFGGVGASGMGNYHGEYSFHTFSHARSYLNRSTLIDPDIRYAPYKGKMGLLKKLMPFPL